QRYAFGREAEHLWIVGQAENALQSLAARVTLVPNENLRRARRWETRIESKFGPDHSATFVIRRTIASWTGECGDAREALRLFQELLLRCNLALSPDHPASLVTRQSIATWTSQCGDAR